MKSRWRVLIVVVPEVGRGLRYATSELADRPPREAVTTAARLLRLGAEVKVMDTGVEQLSPRVVTKEARWWHADLVLVDAGGCHLADDPLPDAKGLSKLLNADWPSGVPILLTGPLAWRYDAELLGAHPNVVGVHRGPVGEWMVGGFEPGTAPGLTTRDGEAHPPAADAVDDLPAWHLLHLEGYPAFGPQGVRVATIGERGDDLEGLMDEVRHGVQRAV